MMTFPHQLVAPALWPSPRRRQLARWLRQAARGLHRLARRVAGPVAQPAPATDLPRFEFHAEAGAPEGALYVDGQWVGRIDVGRL